MLVASRLMPTHLGVDQLGKDESRLEPVDHQRGQVEGRVEIPVDTEHHNPP